MLDLKSEKEALATARDACEVAAAQIDEVLRRIALLEARSEILPDSRLHIHEPVTIQKREERV